MESELEPKPKPGILVWFLNIGSCCVTSRKTGCYIRGFPAGRSERVLNINDKVMLHRASVGVSAGIFAPQVLENSK